MKPVLRTLPLAIALSLPLTACGDKKDASKAAPPPPTVSVITAASGEVTITNELPGRVEASRIAQVRARTPGIVLQRVFKEGGDVKAGKSCSASIPRNSRPMWKAPMPPLRAPRPTWRKPT